MVIDRKTQLAELLRAAAKLTIAESDFWDRFNALADRLHDPVDALAHETAIHYWGNFHARNLLLMKRKTDRYQVEQGQEDLTLIAEGLEKNWSISEIEEKLKNL